MIRARVVAASLAFARIVAGMALVLALAAAMPGRAADVHEAAGDDPPDSVRTPMAPPAPGFDLAPFDVNAGGSDGGRGPRSVAGGAGASGTAGAGGAGAARVTPTYGVSGEQGRQRYAFLRQDDGILKSWENPGVSTQGRIHQAREAMQAELDGLNQEFLDDLRALAARDPDLLVYDPATGRFDYDITHPAYQQRLGQLRADSGEVRAQYLPENEWRSQTLQELLDTPSRVGNDAPFQTLQQQTGSRAGTIQSDEDLTFRSYESAKEFALNANGRGLRVIEYPDRIVIPDTDTTIWWNEGAAGVTPGSAAEQAKVYFDSQHHSDKFSTPGGKYFTSDGNLGIHDPEGAFLDNYKKVLDHGLGSMPQGSEDWEILAKSVVKAGQAGHLDLNDPAVRAFYGQCRELMGPPGPGGTKLDKRTLFEVNLPDRAARERFMETAREQMAQAYRGARAHSARLNRERMQRAAGTGPDADAARREIAALRSSNHAMTDSMMRGDPELAHRVLGGERVIRVDTPDGGYHYLDPITGNRYGPSAAVDALRGPLDDELIEGMRLIPPGDDALSFFSLQARPGFNVADWLVTAYTAREAWKGVWKQDALRALYADDWKLAYAAATSMTVLEATGIIGLGRTVKGSFDDAIGDYERDILAGNDYHWGWAMADTANKSLNRLLYGMFVQPLVDGWDAVGLGIEAYQARADARQALDEERAFLAERERKIGEIYQANLAKALEEALALNAPDEPEPAPSGASVASCVPSHTSYDGIVGGYRVVGAYQPPRKREAGEIGFQTAEAEPPPGKSAWRDPGGVTPHALALGSGLVLKVIPGDGHWQRRDTWVTDVDVVLALADGPVQAIPIVNQIIGPLAESGFVQARWSRENRADLLLTLVKHLEPGTPKTVTVTLPGAQERVLIKDADLGWGALTVHAKAIGQELNNLRGEIGLLKSTLAFASLAPRAQARCRLDYQKTVARTESGRAWAALGGVSQNCWTEIVPKSAPGDGGDGGGRTWAVGEGAKPGAGGRDRNLPSASATEMVERCDAPRQTSFADHQRHLELELQWLTECQNNVGNKDHGCYVPDPPERTAEQQRRHDRAMNGLRRDIAGLEAALPRVKNALVEEYNAFLDAPPQGDGHERRIAGLDWSDQPLEGVYGPALYKARLGGLTGRVADTVRTSLRVFSGIPPNSVDPLPLQGGGELVVRAWEPGRRLGELRVPLEPSARARQEIAARQWSDWRAELAGLKALHGRLETLPDEPATVAEIGARARHLFTRLDTLDGPQFYAALDLAAEHAAVVRYTQTQVAEASRGVIERVAKAWENLFKLAGERLGAWEDSARTAIQDFEQARQAEEDRRQAEQRHQARQKALERWRTQNAGRATPGAAPGMTSSTSGSTNPAQVMREIFHPPGDRAPELTSMADWERVWNATVRVAVKALSPKRMTRGINQGGFAARDLDTRAIRAAIRKRVALLEKANACLTNALCLRRTPTSVVRNFRAMCGDVLSSERNGEAGSTVVLERTLRNNRAALSDPALYRFYIDETEAMLPLLQRACAAKQGSSGQVATPGPPPTASPGGARNVGGRQPPPGTPPGTPPLAPSVQDYLERMKSRSE